MRSAVFRPESEKFASGRPSIGAGRLKRTAFPVRAAISNLYRAPTSIPKHEFSCVPLFPERQDVCCGSARTSSPNNALDVIGPTLECSAHRAF